MASVKWTDEQQAAIDKKGSNILVAAAAGSGKTAVLVERIIKKIIVDRVDIDKILVVTFTNAAASEMRERILEAIYKKIEENPEDANLQKQIILLNKSSICTIDSFCLDVIRNNFYEIDISANARVADSTEMLLLKQEVLDDMFEDKYISGDKDFLDLIDTYTKYNKDEDLKELILKIYTYIQASPFPEEWLNEKVEMFDIEGKYTNFSDTPWGKIIIKNVSDILENGILKLESIRNKMTRFPELEKFINTINIDLVDYYFLKDNLNDWDKCVKAIVALKDKRNNWPTDKKVTNDLKDEAKNIRDSVKEEFKKVKELLNCTSDEAIADINFMYNILNKLKNIILEFSEKFYQKKREKNIMDFNDMEHLALKILVKKDEAGNVVKTEVAKKYEEKFEEIAIDEYQDSNLVQEYILTSVSKGNNVFMVGDVKQSIYKFRQARPQLFIEKYNKYKLEPEAGEDRKIQLFKNFRSREEVINNINLMFDRIMDDTIGGASYKVSHRMVYGNPMYQGDGDNGVNNNFEVYSYLNDTIFKKDEVEAFIIASDIKNKIINGYPIFGKDTKGIRKAKYSDFAILLDSSKSFELYKKILEYNDIPTSIVKSVNLTDGEVITIIKNIIGFIIKIKDNVIDNEFKKLFISIARSFLFNLDDNIIFDYFLNNNFKDSDIYKISYGITKDLDAISLDEIIDIIIDKYDFYNKLFLLGDYSSNIIRIDKLKEITSNLTNLDYDIYKYSEYLEDIIESGMKIEYNVTESSNNTVKIMTIHASKGLEFNVCYYGGLYSKFNIREAISKFSYDDKYGIIIPYKDKFLYNTIYHNLSYRNYVLENISERIRLFYVALTRAKEKMIFICMDRS